jgi:hypothetical protein
VTDEVPAPDPPPRQVLPRPPRYGTADVGMLIPDAVRALTGHAPSVIPLPEGVRGVIVLVVDGLGRRLLDRHADVAPYLAAASGPTLDAPFPSTTATSLTSIGTGLTPGAHGITGYSIAIDGVDRPLVVLTWSWDRHDPTLDARDDVVPETLQPHPTAFDRARDADVEAVTVLRPEFVSSGLTRAGLRGARSTMATGRDETLAAAVREVVGSRRPTVVYAHHGDLDTLGHLHGPSSDAWLAELAAVDDTCARSAADLPPGVALVVTADHGMVHVPRDRRVELAERPDLLAGVRVLTGDFRARQLLTVPGAADDVLAAWRASCGDLAHVVTRDEAIDAGWFGPRVTEVVRRRVGDVVVSARVPDVGWVHRDRDLLGGQIPGMHGALTPEEIEVPALVLTR